MKKSISYDTSRLRYIVQNHNEEFAKLYFQLEEILDELEEALRENIKGIFFPKDADKRFALSSR